MAVVRLSEKELTAGPLVSGCTVHVGEQVMLDAVSLDMGFAGHACMLLECRWRTCTAEHMYSLYYAPCYM